HLVYAITKPAGKNQRVLQGGVRPKTRRYVRSPRDTDGSNGGHTRSRKRQWHQRQPWREYQSTAESGAALHSGVQLAPQLLTAPKSGFRPVARCPSSSPCPAK